MKDITVTRLPEGLYCIEGSTDWGRAVVTKHFGVMRDSIPVNWANVTSDGLRDFEDRFGSLISFNYKNISITDMI